LDLIDSAGAQHRNFSDIEVPYPTIAGIFGVDKLIHPVLEAGDCLQFDQFLFHRTYLAKAMSKPRFSVELRAAATAHLDKCPSNVDKVVVMSDPAADRMHISYIQAFPPVSQTRLGDAWQYGTPDSVTALSNTLPTRYDDTASVEPLRKPLQMVSHDATPTTLYELVQRAVRTRLDRLPKRIDRLPVR
jgi:hypothetical protein